MRKRRSDGGGKILLIVTGGIAVYKSAFLVRLLKRAGADVRVVMSEAATRFVTPLTFEVLSGHPVHVGLFASRDVPAVQHVELSSWAERIVVAPATADFLSKAANGSGDDLASTVLLAARCPVILCPAMNSAMWDNPAVGRNIDTLKRDGRSFVEPDSGELACGETGRGRMAEPEDILRALEASFSSGGLDGVRVLITAGRTEEDIDPVRYISNRSSGRMGFALAREAKRRGARVTLVHGGVDVPAPGVDGVRAVKTAAEMKTAVSRAFSRCDVLIMAAAVSDYAPARKSKSKLRRADGPVALELHPTVDILASLAGRKKAEQTVVGFALEAGGGEKSAFEKAKSKGCDYVVFNAVGERTGFSVPTNRITVYRGKRALVTTPVVSKERAASLILDAIASDARVRRAVKRKST
jgi:phosphopantothenoylcysteine decarboxylase/phosphopantothenate--cysteine ligase